MRLYFYHNCGGNNINDCRLKTSIIGKVNDLLTSGGNPKTNRQNHFLRLQNNKFMKLEICLQRC